MVQYSLPKCGLRSPNSGAASPCWLRPALAMTNTVKAGLEQAQRRVHAAAEALAAAETSLSTAKATENNAVERLAKTERSKESAKNSFVQKRLADVVATQKDAAAAATAERLTAERAVAAAGRELAAADDAAAMADGAEKAAVQAWAAAEAAQLAAAAGSSDSAAAAAAAAEAVASAAEACLGFARKGECGVAQHMASPSLGLPVVVRAQRLLGSNNNR